MLHISAPYIHSAAHLDELFNSIGHGEHPFFTRSDWQDAVSQDETLLGYWAWISSQLEQVDGDEYFDPLLIKQDLVFSNTDLGDLWSKFSEKENELAFKLAACPKGTAVTMNDLIYFLQEDEDGEILLLNRMISSGVVSSRFDFDFMFIDISEEDLELQIQALEAVFHEFTLCQNLEVGEEPHIKVEYDTTYTGGDYSGVGDFAYIPMSLVNAFILENPAEGFEHALYAAFSKQMHVDQMHIVNFNSEEKFTASGEVILS